MEINKTHPNCLQGSAEIPSELMQKAGLEKYQSISVYNLVRGGVADTYVVPTPPKIIMTTGAMANFAKIGEKVNVASYVIGVEKITPKIILTDGSDFLRNLKI